MLRKLVPFKPGEMVTTLVLTANVFVLLTCYYLLKVVREPLILLGGGGAELKAYASAGQTVLLLAAVPAFGMLASRATRIRLLTIVQLIFMGCLVAFYALAKAHAPVGLAFYLWLGIFMMLVAAGGLGLSIVRYRFVDHQQVTGRTVKPAVVAPVGREGGLALVVKDRYLRVLALMQLVATIINTSGEYVVGRMASEQSKVFAAQQVRDAHAAPTPAAPIDDKAIVADARDAYISSFYSDYYMLVNGISLLLQAFVVAWLLEKVGIRRTLFIMPVIVIAGWVGTIVFATVGMVRIEKTAENSLDYSLHNTVRQALFMPTSRESKYKAKAAIDTFFFRMGDVIAGLGLVVLFVEILGLGVRAFAILNVALGVVSLVLTT